MVVGWFISQVTSLIRIDFSISEGSLNFFIVWSCTFMWHGMHVQVRGKLEGVGSLLPLCGFQTLDSAQALCTEQCASLKSSFKVYFIVLLAL